MIVFLVSALLLDIEDTIFNWMWTHAPHLLIIIILIILTIIITVRVMRFNRRFVDTEDLCDDLRNKFVPDLHSKVGGIDKKINLLLLSVTKISTHLITSQGLAANIFEAKSPIELTELGVKILNEVGGKKYIDENANDLIAEIESRSPKSGLDVQTYSNAVLTYKTSEDGFTHIKNYVFQNPVYDLVVDGKQGKVSVSVDIGMVTQIMGIYLRNKYFEKYPEMKKDL